MSITIATAQDIDLESCKLVNLRVTAPHCIAMRFRDGLIAELDFEDWLASESGPAIEPLKSASHFARVGLEEGILTWPNGYDLDPVTLRTWAECGYCSRPV